MAFVFSALCTFPTSWMWTLAVDVLPSARCSQVLLSRVPGGATLCPIGQEQAWAHGSGSPKAPRALQNPTPTTPALLQFPVPGDLASLSCYCCYLNRPMSQPPEVICQYPEDEILSSSISSFPPTAQCAETSPGQASESPPARP